MTKILLVEDDADFAERCMNEIYRVGLSVDYCADAVEAYDKIQQNDYALALIDLMLPPSYEDEGLRVQSWVLAKNKNMPIIFMTVRKDDTVSIVATAMKRGAKDFFDKNDPDVMLQLTIRLREILMQEQNRIFLSHGHNELLKLKLQAFVDKRLGIKTVVLADQPNEGLTIVEKLEKTAKQCRFAIILLTKDDEQKHDAVRARQNVVHELGFFQGKYGRKNVVLLAERGVELFSNISGIVRIDFEPDHFDAIFDPLRLEIEQSGLTSGQP